MAEATGESAADAAKAAAATATSTTEALLKSLMQRANQDIGADEFISCVLANAGGLQVLNGKLQLDNAMEAAQSSIKSTQSHVKNVQAVELQMLTNMASNSDAMMKQHLNDSKLGSDRQWNLNETDQMATIVTSILSNLGIKSDAGAAALLEALGRILREAQKPA